MILGLKDFPVLEHSKPKQGLEHPQICQESSTAEDERKLPISEMWYSANFCGKQKEYIAFSF